MKRAGQTHAKNPESSIGTTLQRRLHIRKTPLQAAFACLQPNWSSWIQYVEIASGEGDEEMAKLLHVYQKFSAKEQRSATPEYCCHTAGVKIEDLIAAVTPLMWRYSNLESSVISAIYNPRVIKRTAQVALRASAKDRETFLKVTGALPTAKGGTTVNMPIANAGSIAESQITHKPLSSAGKEVLELDAAELDDE